MRYARRLLPLAVLALSACSDGLAVLNQNSPDRDRALARPSDVENVLAGGFNGVIQGTTGGGIESANTSMQTMALENASSLANFNMGPRGGIPRGRMDNSRGNPGTASMAKEFNALTRNARLATIALEPVIAGTTSFATAGDNIRAKAFGRFVIGVSIGYLAMTYDSVGVVVPGADPVPPLVGYDSAGRAALAQLDSAEVYANDPNMSSIPVTWFNIGSAVSRTQFLQIIRSYRAKIRAGIPRSPAETVDWARVLADATGGITADLNIVMNASTGAWTQAWMAQHFVSITWHAAPMWIIGMADSTGAYANWLNAPLASRGQDAILATGWVIQTTDRRFPVGATRAAQNASGNGSAPGTVLPAGMYYRNRRAGEDQADPSWTYSQYDHARYMAFYNASRNGNFPVFTLVENNMLRAEALIRTGQVAAAAALINVTRVANGGLPAITATDTLTPVPGGNACVPRVPRLVGATFTLSCGNIIEAMKWEKRIEASFTNFGIWFFDMRRWGDLVEGTPVSFPVPWGELDVRIKPFYGLGGVGLPGGAARGTYGF